MPTDDSKEAPVHTPSRVFDELWRARTLLLFGEITMQRAETVSAQLLALASASDAPIRVVINSPGGHVEAGDTLHDVIRFIDSKVLVLGTGWVASAAGSSTRAEP